MILGEKYSLSNGVEVPKIGLGTWFIRNKDVAQAIVEATKLGYRHIDTAQAYRNEAGVGDGVRMSGLNREELFVTSKLAAEAKSYAKAKKAIDKSLSKMKLDYIDLMLIHSPQPWMKFRGDDRYFDGNKEAWRALEDAYNAGKLKSIGLANFEKVDIDNILASSTVDPMVNQILAHISNTPTDLINYSKEKGMVVEAYSPIGHGVLLENEKIAEMAKKYNVSIPQLAIRYDIQLGLLPLPKTANPKHMANNADVDFEISQEDMVFLLNMEKIKDYGDAGIMPVFGGKLNLGTIFKMIIRSIRG